MKTTTMNTKEFSRLKALNLDPEVLEWTSQFETIQDAWNNCDRGDWMLSLLGLLSGKTGSKSRKELVFITCQCARLSLKYVPKGEDRPLKAIEAGEAYSKGLIPLSEVEKAADAAHEAAANAAAFAAAVAADAADAAFYAVDAAYAAAYVAAAFDAADAAAYVADAAYDAHAAAAFCAVDDAAHDAADAEIYNQEANIIRRNHPLIEL